MDRDGIASTRSQQGEKANIKSSTNQKMARVVDSFGSLNKEFVSLVDEIEETATRGLGRSLPTRMTRATFLALFGSQWQADNAAIIAQWLGLCRRLRLRGIPRWRSAPVPASAPPSLCREQRDASDGDDDNEVFSRWPVLCVLTRKLHLILARIPPRLPVSQ